MFHLSLYSVTSGATAAAVLTDMPAVSDPAVTIVNNHVIFPVPVWLAAFYGFGQTDITDFQLTTPKLRTIALPHFRPFDAATTPTTRPPIVNYKKHPLSLNAIDENSVQLSAGTYTSGNSYYGACWFSDNNFATPMGDIFTARFTSTITAVTGSWVNGAITLQNPLPAGKYTVLGLDVYGTNLAFARLVFPSQVWRPGCLAGGNAGFFNAPCFRLGELGQWGTFDSFAQPQLDIFAIGANTAQTGIMDLLKVA